MKRVSLNTNRQRKLFWQELLETALPDEIEQGLKSINPTSARVLKWRYLEGHDFPAIVSLLGKSISIVRNHHNRGIFELQKYFLDTTKNISNNDCFS